MNEKETTVCYEMTCINHRDRYTRKLKGKGWEKLYHANKSRITRDKENFIVINLLDNIVSKCVNHMENSINL